MMQMPLGHFKRTRLHAEFDHIDRLRCHIVDDNFHFVHTSAAGSADMARRCRLTAQLHAGIVHIHLIGMLRMSVMRKRMLIDRWRGVINGLAFVMVKVRSADGIRRRSNAGFGASRR